MCLGGRLRAVRNSSSISQLAVVSQPLPSVDLDVPLTGQMVFQIMKRFFEKISSDMV